MTLLFYFGLFLAAVVITLGGCALFTNGIEWLGKRLRIPEGAIGSIFAAIGTTLPETSIPIIAIFFGTGQERTEVGLGAILGAPFMLATLVLPILAILLVLYARLGKRQPVFKLNYHEVQTDLRYFLIAYGLAIGCAFVPSKPVHYAVAVLLAVMYLFYMKLKFAGEAGETGEEGGLAPLFFARRAANPAYWIIGLQAIVGIAGLVGGAHLFVTAAKAMAVGFHVSPLLLALFIAPLATELPEMSNSFLWLYQRKDKLAVGNVTGAMVFQGTFPVAVGLIGTEWTLGTSPLTTMVLALLAVGSNLGQLRWDGHWRPWLLGSGAILYIGFSLYLYGS